MIHWNLRGRFVQQTVCSICITQESVSRLLRLAVWERTGGRTWYILRNRADEPMARGVHCCPSFLNFFYPTSVSILCRRCVYIHISECVQIVYELLLLSNNNTSETFLTHCGRVTQICVFNTVNLGTSASSLQCHSTRRNFSRGIVPSSTTRVFGEYFLKISVHKNSQRICYKFLKKHSIKVD